MSFMWWLASGAQWVDPDGARGQRERPQHKTTLGVPKPLRIYLQVAIRMSHHYLEVNSKRLGGRCRMGLGAVNAAPCVHGRRSARGAVNKRPQAAARPPVKQLDLRRCATARSRARSFETASGWWTFATAPQDFVGCPTGRHVKPPWAAFERRIQPGTPHGDSRTASGALPAPNRSC